MGEQRPVEPFSDVCIDDGKVRATLLHDPTVEGLDVGLYLDGSGSMREEYAYSREQPRRSFWQWLRGEPKPPAGPATNLVEPQARWMLRYLASKDRNGALRVAYWACGSTGKEVEVIGELNATNVDGYQFPGPAHQGGHTFLAPAIRDYIKYLKSQVEKGARRGLAVFITDGQLHDADEVERVTAELARMIVRGQIPRTNLVLVGVGDAVDAEQLEKVACGEQPGVGQLWCSRIATEIQNVAELVATLVDETMTVAAGGTVYDHRGEVLKEYEARLPAVLEFAVPEGCTSFTLEVGGQRFTQPLSGEDH